MKTFLTCVRIKLCGILKVRLQLKMSCSSMENYIVNVKNVVKYLSLLFC